MSTKPDRTDVSNLKRNFVEPLADPFSDKLKKNHTVGTVPKFNRKRGTDTSKKGDGLNYIVVVCFPLSEMMWACTCIPRVCKMHILCSLL